MQYTKETLYLICLVVKCQTRKFHEKYLIKGAIHKPSEQILGNFWHSSPLREQVYVCNRVAFFLSPLSPFQLSTQFMDASVFSILFETYVGYYCNETLLQISILLHFFKYKKCQSMQKIVTTQFLQLILMTSHYKTLELNQPYPPLPKT